MVSAFDLANTYVLTHKHTKVFTESADIELMGAGADYDVGQYYVMIFYKRTDENDRGKVVTVHLDDEDEDVITYHYMPQITPIDNKIWIHILRDFDY